MIFSDSNYQEPGDIRYLHTAIEVRSEKTLQGKIIASLKLIPGHPCKVAESFNIHESAVYSAARAYCQNEYWDGTSIGGHPPYLSYVDEEILRTSIFSSNHYQNSLTTEEIIEEMMRIKLSRQKLALANAEQLQLIPLIKKFSCQIHPPDKSCVSRLMKKLGITIVKASSPDSLRYLSSTASNIKFWFDNIYTPEICSIFDSEDIFNADKTMMTWSSSKLVYKAPGIKRAVTNVTETFNSHLTVMVSFSNGYSHPPPFFILSSLKNIPESIQDSHISQRANISVNQNGFMTKDLFYQWSISFTEWLVRYRQELHKSPESPVLLFLDGHSSRMCPEAIENFRNNNVMVITFPSHLTHIMQPFDVGLAYPMKAYHKNILRKLKKSIKRNNGNDYVLSISDKRILLMESVLDSLQQTLIHSNITNSFMATGICPYNPSIVLSSPYVRNDLANPIHPNGRHSSRKNCSSCILTNDEVLGSLKTSE